MQVEHQLVIRAPVERVWALTVDIERWPELTPTMRSVERLDDGPLQVGSRARVVQPRQRPRTWTVTRLEAPHLFEWTTRLGPIEMRAEHRLEQVPEGCRNTLRVEVTGRGAALFALAKRVLTEAIETENEGFRRAAESSPT